MSSRLLVVMLLVLAVNLPFGAWREGCRKFSFPWFAAVHAPVPLVVAIRIAAGVGWRPANLPFLVAAYFAGQYLGGRWRRRQRR